MTYYFGIAYLLRLAFICYGTYHDKLMEVKYTDVDYTVFTEAAEYITNAESPYLKDTYKYTPLLAYILTPNIYVHILFGKWLFCTVDIFVAFILKYILENKVTCNTSSSNILISIFWLYNPFTITISSRGSAESLQIFLVLLTLLFIMRENNLLAAVCFGISVHFKLYPVIYTLPILLYISRQHGLTLNNDSPKRVVIDFFCCIVNRHTITFGVISLFTFCVIGTAMYTKHGFEFIENTYLFHMKRKDFQHNFSPFFYILRIVQDTPWLNIVNRLAFIPQLIAVIWFGIRYYHVLPLACFLQTFAFVSLNKVCTSQYFIWYIGLLPLAYPYIKFPVQKGVTMVVAWLVSQAIWLCSAYLLEFRKLNIILYVWLASILFLCTNIWLMYHFTKYAAVVENYNLKYDVKKRKPLKSS